MAFKTWLSPNPETWLQHLDRWAKAMGWLCLVCWGVGLVWALVIAPPDVHQGQAMRILYIHVPASWGALAIYTLMALASAVFLVWRAPVGDLIAFSLAPIGAAFTLISLLTGMLWGRPMWGTWWVWDARLTSMLILGLLYGGYIALRQVVDDPIQASRSGAFLAILGWLNVPIIKGSVYWWSTLHQPASILRKGGPSMPLEMLWPLAVMVVAWAILTVILFRSSFRLVVLQRKRLVHLGLE